MKKIILALFTLTLGLSIGSQAQELKSPTNSVSQSEAVDAFKAYVSGQTNKDQFGSYLLTDTKDLKVNLDSIVQFAKQQGWDKKENLDSQTEIIQARILYFGTSFQSQLYAAQSSNREKQNRITMVGIAVGAIAGGVIGYRAGVKFDASSPGERSVLRYAGRVVLASFGAGVGAIGGSAIGYITGQTISPDVRVSFDSGTLFEKK